MWVYVLVGVLVIFVIILICVMTSLYWNGKVNEIKEKFALEEGGVYNITLNNGRTHRALTFVSIYQGRKSANGNINLLFTRQVKYQDTFTKKEVIIKYNNIWKVERIK